jgi:hypothetical protein
VEEDDRNQGNYYQGILNLQSNALAYMVGPRKDGKILTKAGTIIYLNVPTVNNPVRQADRITDELPYLDYTVKPPHWTPHLMVIQLCQLRKGYKRKATQMKARLMRQIRRTTQRRLNETNIKNATHERTHAIDYIPYQSILPHYHLTTKPISETYLGSEDTRPSKCTLSV